MPASVLRFVRLSVTAPPMAVVHVARARSTSAGAPAGASAESIQTRIVVPRAQCGDAGCAATDSCKTSTNRGIEPRCKKFQPNRSSPERRPAPMGDPRLYQIGVLASLLVYGMGWLDFDITVWRAVLLLTTVVRSEERRVGSECRSRCGRCSGE